MVKIVSDALIVNISCCVDNNSLCIGIDDNHGTFPFVDNRCSSVDEILSSIS